MRADRNSLPAVSLVLSRHIPPVALAAWQRERVQFLLDDANGCFDVLADPETSPRSRAQARDWLARLRQVAGWNRVLFEREAWLFIENRLERPQDAFAPALVLQHLAPAGAAAQWLAALTPEVRAAVAAENAR